VYHDAVGADLCRQIIEKYDQSENRRQPGGLYDNRQCETVEASKILDWKILDAQLEAVVGSVLTKHYSEYGVALPFSDEGYEVCCYEPGQICVEHCDGTALANRSARLWALAMYLNDCEEGKVVFPRQGIEVVPKAGTVAVWPPHMTHPHKTLPADTKRYMVVTWSGLIYPKGHPSAA